MGEVVRNHVLFPGSAWERKSPGLRLRLQVGLWGEPPRVSSIQMTLPLNLLRTTDERTASASLTMPRI
ncbi:hypothetical protein Mal15_00490 [Stieleria maiorica]|uniref:Uncharacterized protein n=1 Tax=Stieleria maiorica TaxID=2795974 RepID=A0A5B9M5W6_9BACT|nr:hypothetical protein Mal15_00490 [Stieleria maiorica]